MGHPAEMDRGVNRREPFLCPNCRSQLILPEETAEFDFIFMSRVECQEMRDIRIAAQNILGSK